MATSVKTSLPMWLSGVTYDASGGNDLRQSGVAAMYFDPGIVIGSTINMRGGVIGGAGLSVYPGSGLTVFVQPGSFVVPNTATPSAGGYAATLPAIAALTVQTADPSNARIDIVVAYVSDLGTSASYGAVAIITGAAAPSPAAPPAPANSIILAQIRLTAAAPAVTNGMITDTRPFTTTTGGILVAPKGAVVGYRGQVAYDPVSGSFYHNNNSNGTIPTASQMRVLPWEPVVAKNTASVNWAGNPGITILSVTFTTDGNTDIEAFFKWAGVSCSTNQVPLFQVYFQMYLDNVQLDGYITSPAPPDGVLHSGGSWSYYTNGATGDTPSAGTHTLRVGASNWNGTFPTAIYADNGTKNILRVEPVAM